MSASYVSEMRARVGRHLLLVPSALVLPVDRDGRVLLVWHGDLDRWAILGGSIEVDEDPRDAALRESQEEIGATVESLELLGVLGGPEYRVTYPNGDQCSCVCVVYTGWVDPAAVTPDGIETTDARWFSSAELRELPGLSEFARAVLTAAGFLHTGSALPAVEASAGP